MARKSPIYLLIKAVLLLPALLAGNHGVGAVSMDKANGTVTETAIQVPFNSNEKDDHATMSVISHIDQHVNNTHMAENWNNGCDSTTQADPPLCSTQEAEDKDDISTSTSTISDKEQQKQHDQQETPLDDDSLIPTETNVNGQQRRANYEEYARLRDKHCQWRQETTSPSSSSSSSPQVRYMYWETDQALKADYWGDLLSWTMTGGAHVQNQWIVQVLQWWYDKKNKNRSKKNRQQGQELQSFFCSVPTSAVSSPSSSDTNANKPTEEALPPLQEQEQWRIRRVGPFVGQGGFDWHRIQVLDAFLMQDYLDSFIQEDDKSSSFTKIAGYTITGRFLGPIQWNGDLLSNTTINHQTKTTPTTTLLANPPVHIHHANLNVRHSQTNFGRVGQWHGDSQCAHQDGGTACYLRSSSEYGFPIRVNQKQLDGVGIELDLDADLNDVREDRKEDTPEPLVFYLEAAVRVSPLLMQNEDRVNGSSSNSKNIATTTMKYIAKSPKKPAGVLILGTPARFRYWQSTDFAGTYFVPTDTPSVLWATATFPVSGTFIPGGGHIYTHQMLFQEAWYLTGISPSELGLFGSTSQNAGAPFVMNHPWEPWVPAERGWADPSLAVEALKQQVLTSLQNKQDYCRVSGEDSDESECTEEPQIVFQLNKTVLEAIDVTNKAEPELEARQIPWPSDQPWTFHRGQQYTVVVFHKAMKMASDNDGASSHHAAPSSRQKWVQQHLALHGTYLPGEGEAAQYHYVIPASENPDDAWIDAPNVWTLAVCFGGPMPWWSCVTPWKAAILTAGVSLMVLLLRLAGVLFGSLLRKLANLLVFCWMSCVPRLAAPNEAIAAWWSRQGGYVAIRHHGGDDAEEDEAADNDGNILMVATSRASGDGLPQSWIDNTPPPDTHEASSTEDDTSSGSSVTRNQENQPNPNHSPSDINAAEDEDIPQGCRLLMNETKEEQESDIPQGCRLLMNEPEDDIPQGCQSDSEVQGIPRACQQAIVTPPSSEKGKEEEGIPMACQQQQD